MPRRPEFEPLETPSGWMVSLPASMTATGKRKKKYFPSKTAAEKFAAKLRASYASGVRGGVISQTLAIQAAEAARILDGTGIGLVEAARMAAGKLKENGGKETFGERYDRAMAGREDAWSERYRLDMERLPRWVPKWFLDLPCGAVDRETMERALTDGRTLSRSTLDARCRYLSAVLGYRERHRKSAEIAILSTRECGRLLRACESREEVRAVALLLFAGIRPDAEHGEIKRLDWSEVGKKEIYVSREVSKVGDRHVPITRRLRRLLRGHPKDGPVVPANWKRVWARLRKTAGITGQDVTRHTFASHYLAAYGDRKAKNAMGHTKGSDTLFRHYRRAVTHDDGVRFFR